MFTDPEGPITSFEWGRYQINGQTHSMDGEGVGKDICIVDGEVRPWSERKGHRLNPLMVECVFGQGVEVLVIGKGVKGRIRVLKKTQKAILAAGIKMLMIEKTPEACGIYNRLIKEGKRAALLAHGTC